MSSIQLVATGSFLPPNIVTNNDLSKIVETNDEWIQTRTGISQRRFCKKETTTDMACAAAQKAIENANIDKNDINICIVATFTPDNFTPSTACMVQKNLCLPEHTLAFDLNAACSGYVYALQTANALLAQQNGGYALVIGADRLTSVMDMADRSTCVLFGDGAGATIIKTDKTKDSVWCFGSRGDDISLVCPAHDTADKKAYITMEGNDVFRFATEVLHKTFNVLCEKSNKKPEQIQHIVCHQANLRIINHVIKKTKLPADRFFTNLQNYGNTSAASIPIALDEMNQKGLLKSGDTAALIGFGGGLTWGGTIITV